MPMRVSDLKYRIVKEELTLSDVIVGDKLILTSGTNLAQLTVADVAHELSDTIVTGTRGMVYRSGMWRIIQVQRRGA